MILKTRRAARRCPDCGKPTRLNGPCPECRQEPAATTGLLTFARPGSAGRVDAMARRARAGEPLSNAADTGEALEPGGDHQKGQGLKYPIRERPKA